jgi:hypothetical protein
MDCEFIVESESDVERPALSGWEAVVFELEDDPAYVVGSRKRLAAPETQAVDVTDIDVGVMDLDGVVNNFYVDVKNLDVSVREPDIDVNCLDINVNIIDDNVNNIEVNEKAFDVDIKDIVTNVNDIDVTVKDIDIDDADVDDVDDAARRLASEDRIVRVVVLMPLVHEAGEVDGDVVLDVDGDLAL